MQHIARPAPLGSRLTTAAFLLVFHLGGVALLILENIR